MCKAVVIPIHFIDINFMWSAIKSDRTDNEVRRDPKRLAPRRPLGLFLDK
jgi:hypothetical protein